VGIYLVDPVDYQVASGGDKVKSNKLTIDEVAATGEHKIAIWSNQIGEFTIVAKFTAPAELDKKALEDDIRTLEAELKRKREQLEALNKSPQKQK
jgi:dynactin complex subunit